MSFAIRIVLALVLAAVIWRMGMAVLRSASSDAGRSEHIDPEDVRDLDVYFVCEECGTEYQVTQLGQIQVPRHCGEPMEVVRRPKADPGPSLK